MSRPKGKRQPAVVWNVKLLLFYDEDDDLIGLYDRTPERKRAAAVKAAMRGGMVQGWQAVEEDDAAMYASLEGLVL